MIWQLTHLNATHVQWRQLLQDVLKNIQVLGWLLLNICVRLWKIAAILLIVASAVSKTDELSMRVAI